MNERWSCGGGQTQYPEVVGSLGEIERTYIGKMDLQEWSGCCGNEKIPCKMGGHSGGIFEHERGVIGEEIYGECSDGMYG